MKTTLRTKNDIVRNWHVLDASQTALGRLCTQAAVYLMGKHKPDYTPNVDGGDFVLVINADNVKLSGRKAEQKEYTRFSGYPGGISRISIAKVRKERPEFMFTHAVDLMLPKNKLRKLMLRRLKVVRGTEHKYPVGKPKIKN